MSFAKLQEGMKVPIIGDFLSGNLIGITAVTEIRM
jgi:hypothetical protein